MNNVKFTDDKLRINYVNQKNLLSGGTVSILYQDISSMSVVRNDSKYWMIIIAIASIGFGLYLGLDYGKLSIVLGVIILIVGILIPKNYLGVETRGGSLYWGNVKGSNPEDLIDKIEDIRSKFK